MTIPTLTDSNQRPTLAVVPDQDDAALYLTPEEERELSDNRLVHCTLDLTAASPYDPAPFDSFRAFLPADGYVVYHLLDRWGDPLYIGQTGQPRARLRAHWSTKPWIGEVCGIRLYQTVSEHTARNVELGHTERYEPPYSQVTASERMRLTRLHTEQEAIWAAEDAAADAAGNAL